MKVALSKHVLCGTCIGEYDRRAGVFESKRARDAILDGQLTIGCYQKRYCCRCGAWAYVDGTFKQAEGSNYPCNGEHSEEPP